MIDPARKAAWRAFPQPMKFESARPCKQCADPTPIRYTRSDLCVTCALETSRRQRIKQSKAIVTVRGVLAGPDEYAAKNGLRSG